MKEKEFTAMNRSLKNVRCFECNELHHYCNHYPGLVRQVATIRNAPNFRRVMKNPHGRHNGGHGKNRGRD